MSYIVNLPNGTLLTTILDGTVDTTASSLTLVGRNYSGYGEIIAEDLVALLVNFSDTVAPDYPNTGQIWYDSSNKIAKVYTGTTWKNIGSATAQTTPPSTTIAGDFWWDTTNKQLYCYDGTTPFAASGWILVGPGYSTVTGKSGAITEQLSDGSSFYDVVSVYLNGIRTSIISQAAFTPNVSITGFNALQIGWNMSSTTSRGTIWGTANNASYLGGQIATNYFRTNLNNTGSGTLTIQNDGGVTLGQYNNANLTVVSNTVVLWNNVSDTDIEVYATTANVKTKYLSINGTSGAVEVAASPTTTLGVATKGYVDNSFVNANLTGVSTAITAPEGTANTMIATTEFVINNAGLFSYKIYQGDSHLWINDGGTGAANLVLDGTTVMTATSSGVSLNTGATANTVSQTYNATGDSTIATTEYAKTASTWWGGSAKFVSNVAPVAGVNDIGSNDGDFWFQYAN
jgi:hypothetical protein